MKVFHRKLSATISLGLVASACTPSAAAQPIGREEVKRVVEQCENVAGGLDLRLGQANGVAAYQAAGLVGSTCQDASRELLRPGSAQACRDAVQAGVILGDVAGNAIDQPGPANGSRLDQARAMFTAQMGECKAALG